MLMPLLMLSLRIKSSGRIPSTSLPYGTEPPKPPRCLTRSRACWSVTVKAKSVSSARICGTSIASFPESLNRWKLLLSSSGPIESALCTWSRRCLRIWAVLSPAMKRVEEATDDVAPGLGV